MERKLLTTCLAISRDTNVGAKHYDYVFEELQEFIKSAPLRMPPFKGMWSVALFDITIEEFDAYYKLKEEDFIKVDVYVNKEILLKRNQSVIDESPWDKYMKMLENYPHIINKDASRYLYFGCEGNVDSIRDILLDLKDKDIDVITVDILKSYILYQRKVYASNIILAIYTKSNKYITKEDTLLFHHTRKDPVYLIGELVNSIGDEYAFYALRKQIYKLFDFKRDYINGTINTSKISKTYYQLIKKIDYTELLFAYYLFKTYTGDCIYIVLLLLERRTKNVSYFTREIISNSYTSFSTDVR